MSNKLEIKTKAEENNTYSLDLPNSVKIAWIIEINDNSTPTYKLVFQTENGASNSVYYFINQLIMNNVFKSINEIEKMTVVDSFGTYTISGNKLKLITSNRSPISDEVQINFIGLDSEDDLPFIVGE